MTRCRSWLKRGHVKNPVAASPSGNGGKRLPRKPQQTPKKDDDEKVEEEEEKEKDVAEPRDKKDNPSSPKK